MIKPFEFATVDRILFGAGRLAEIGSLASTFGKRVFIVCGEGGAQPEVLLDRLKASNLDFELYRVHGEPTIQTIQKGVNLARTQIFQVVIGYGGGSVMDTAKAIGGLTPQTGEVIDYLEVIGHGKALPGPGLPVITIPTTAGTGAEVTRNAVIASTEHQFKASLRSPYLLPKIALVDPEVTLSMPAEVTASTGMDALTQLIEAFVSVKANRVVDAFCREGIPLAAQALPRAFNHPDDLEAHQAMSLAALLSGLALANAGLGAVHGFASPLAGTYEAPHGQICARLLAPVTRVNFKALKEREPESEKINRYEEVARMVTGNPEATVEDGIAWLEKLTEDLQIPRLGVMGVKIEDIPEQVGKAQEASSMKANPIRLTREELEGILRRAM